MQIKFSKKFIICLFLAVILIYIVCTISIELPFSQSQKHQVKINNNLAYTWQLNTHRRNIFGPLPDRLRIYAEGSRLTFDSTKEKPFFDEKTGKPTITTSLNEQSGLTVFHQIFNYPYATVDFSYNLDQSQKYIDLKVQTKYLQDKSVQSEGFDLGLPRLGVSYYNEEFKKQSLGLRSVQISQWSPHIIESSGVTITDNSAEVMALSRSLLISWVKFYSYYGPIRNNVYKRDYENASVAQPKIDTNLKHLAGDTVTLSVHAIFTPEKLNLLPFRWPYAKDAVVAIVAHADLGSFVVEQTDAAKRILAVFYGTSDKNSPKYGKGGILGHDIRMTNAVFSVNNDVTSDKDYYSTLENPDYQAAVTDIFRHGIEIVPHRLTADGIGSSQDVASKINLAFQLLAKYAPTTWTDHDDSGDCVNTPTRELISGCASIKGNPLYLVDRLVSAGYKYVWADGQDSQDALYRDYLLNAYDQFNHAAQILYYYQGATGAELPTSLKMFASSIAHETHMFTPDELDQLSAQKGYNNTHTYFVNYGSGTITGSVPSGPKNDLVWKVNEVMETEFALLQKYQDQDKILTSDTSTILDFLTAWHQIQIVDFDQNSLTIKNTGANPIDGLTLLAPSGQIQSAQSGNVIYPYLRQGYVVLPRLASGETRTIQFKLGTPDAQLPQIVNFTDKHIDISQMSYLTDVRQLEIDIAPMAKPGQDLTVDNTDIVIKLPANSNPKILRDNQNYTGFKLDGQTLTLSTDTNSHQFLINL
jgi:hypothetical protein